MRKYFWKNQKGSIAVMSALMIPVLVGLSGLATDIGNLCVAKTKIQNAVDAAVLAGGLVLPDTAQATAQAKSFITNNGFNQDTATITFTTDPVKNPGNLPQINCSMTNNVPTYFMGMFGSKTVTIKALAEGILASQASPGGPFNYTIFTGNPGIDLVVNGASLTIKGSIHSNDDLKINAASLNISGTAEAVNKVTINAASSHVGSIQNNVSSIDIPDYSQQIAAAAGQVYNGDKTFNGAIDQINNSIYVKGNVTINGATVNGTGAILADNNININGAGVTINGSNQVCLYSANGNINVNAASFSNNSSSAIIYAPKGTATINTASTKFQGRVIAKNVMINGASMTFDGDDNPVTSLPAGIGKGHVQLIK
jgi:Flp pilus assembly protein TadG